MNRRPLAVLILAAGEGKRMKSDLPKVLHLVSGKPMISRVVETAQALKPEKIVAVVGAGRELVKSELSGSGVEFAIQDRQLGTGHAVLQAKDSFSDFHGDLLILSGDVPLLSEISLDKILRRHYVSCATATVLSTIIDNPTGYGRVIRSNDGNLERIVEEMNCSEDERKIREINAGIYLFRSEVLFRYLPKVSNANVQQEYYLPDVLPMIIEDDGIVAVEQINDALEVAGVNSPEQLEELNLAFEESNEIYS